MMDKLLYLISEGFKNVWRHKMTTFTAVFSLFLALYFVGLLATAGENTKYNARNNENTAVNVVILCLQTFLNPSEIRYRSLSIILL
jgi:cell division protein FtsX